MSTADNFRLQAAIAICKSDGTWDKCKELISEHRNSARDLTSWAEARRMLDGKFGVLLSFKIRCAIGEELDGR